MASLYDRHDLYDLIAPPNPAMEAFYVDQAKARGSRVLDLACGSGRVTIPLAKAGLEVVGIDLSAPMLTRTQHLASASGVDVTTHLRDMRDFSLEERQFDTVLIAGNSIQHLLTAADFEGFFQSVARHLAPGGRLLFDCFVPSPALLSRPGVRQPLTSAVHASLGEIHIEEIIDYDHVTQVADTTWFWSTKAEPDFHVTQFFLRSISPLPLLLQTNGFTLVQRFGDFEGRPLSSVHFRQVCICEAAS